MFFNCPDAISALGPQSRTISFASRERNISEKCSSEVDERMLSEMNE
jgi:hypothetical protein